MYSPIQSVYAASGGESDPKRLNDRKVHVVEQLDEHVSAKAAEQAVRYAVNHLT